MSQQGVGRAQSGPQFLPFRPRSRARSDTASISSTTEKRPTHLVPHDASHHKYLLESSYYSSARGHIRSPTASSISSVMSGSIDTATTRSLASPISTSYASDCLESLTEYSDEEENTCSIIKSYHLPKGSYSSCFTFFDDDSGSSDRAPSADPQRDVRSRTQTPEPRERDELSETANHVKQETYDDETPSGLHECAPSQDAAETVHDLETGSVASDDDCFADDSQVLLDFALQRVYGLELREACIPMAASQRLTLNYIRELGQLMWQAPVDGQGANNMPSSMSTPSQGSSSDSQRGGKRKKQGNNGKPDDGAEETSDGEGAGDLPPKRPKPNPKEDESLRLSCPFRKRNPHRFNVRDHHSCAMTYFPKFAELRQHIVKQHKRDDPSAFMCDRCNRDFLTRKELRDHQRLPKEQMCDISDHDPESGIDGPTANKLLSRKRASGTTPEVQWREVWNIVFPDDEDAKIQSYHFTPVIEHFELSSRYLESFHLLQGSLRNMISNPNTLDTLATQFQQCFIESVQRCIRTAQNMPYANRSNKKNEPPKGQNVFNDYAVPRKGRGILPRPDSGVVMDDGSDESGSTTGGANNESKDSGRNSARNSQYSIVKPTSHPSRESLQPQNSYSMMQSQSQSQSHYMQISPEALMSLDPSAITGVNHDVQVWSDGLPGPPQTTLALPEYFIPATASNVTPTPDLGDWNTSFYQDGNGPGMDDFGFTSRQY
ncbi:hypothetical protein B0I35DRAFT_85590 [Stachybotrys elegans]|uniref:C2H2-type domain-containing protein n=1 Tax=Stachybotrys elegans TaxID=80388 RepID=A0A8K0SML6_9HYPO|nr:hypothetical protein B0I35DRAFT_85590 [Stachybotrys elegans]